MKHITDYFENGRTFVICKNDRGFWAFEDKFIENGKLIKEFNGISGKLSKTLEEVVKRVHDQIVFDALIEQGVEKGDALLRVFMGV